MKALIIHFRELDWILIVVSLLLSVLGLFFFYTSSRHILFQRQLIFLVFGLFLLFLFSFFDYQIFRNSPYLILILYLLSLLALFGLFFIAPEIRGTHSWYKIGSFSLDPAELSKIILIILFAKYFSSRHVEMYRLRHIIISGLYLLLPVFLIFRQPNLGSALIFIAIWLGILIISGIKVRHFFLLLATFLLLFCLGWSFFLKDYQKERISSFFYPQQDPLKSGWHQRQAKIAVGSGGLLGKGFGKGPQTQYGFLPAFEHDFIFAAFAEETGLLGATLLLFLYSILIWRIIIIAKKARNNFSRLFSAGFAVYLLTQIFINIGMNLGLLPIIGVSLPLLSYGGSGLVSTFIGLGILQSIWRDKTRNRI